MADWHLIPKRDLDDDGRIYVVSSIRHDDALELQLKVEEFEIQDKTWHIRCASVLEYSLRHEPASSVELSSDNPVLWKYRYDSASAYFKGTTPNPLTAVGALLVAHQQAVGDWYSMGEFLNSNVELLKLLAGGHGLLAKGPLPLLTYYAEALKSLDIEVDIVSPYPPGGYMSSPELQKSMREDSRVLLLGNSYVVGVGWEFRDVTSLKSS